MRLFLFLISAIALLGCDRKRVYERNHDFNDRHWLVNDKPTFEFDIADTLQAYNLYCNIRNTVDYPYSRIFISYALQDSANVSLKKELISSFLFDEKTGKPFGSSGLGDIYDQQVLVLKNYTFTKTGSHKIQFEQFMRTDTLEGILAIGLRIEAALPTE